MAEVFQLPLSPFSLMVPEVQVAPDDSILVALNEVRSFSRTLQDLQWTFFAPDAGLLGAGLEPPRLTLGEGQVFVASVGILYAVDLATGAPQWQKTIDPNPNGRLLPPAAYLPAASDGSFPAMVFVTDGVTVLGIRASDGQTAWSVRPFGGAEVNLLVSATAQPARQFPNGVVFVTIDRAETSNGVSIAGLSPRDGVAHFRSPSSLNRVTTLPVVTAGRVFFAGLDPIGLPNFPPIRTLFGFELANLGQSPDRFVLEFPDARPGAFEAPVAVILGLNENPNEPTFCWTTPAGEFLVQNGRGPSSTPVPVSLQPPSVPIAYFNDEGEGRAFLVGNTPAGSPFAAGTLIALPIGTDPQFSFTILSRLSTAGPTRFNRRQFAAAWVLAVGGGGFVFAFDLNSL
ncbi:MAG: PQQ-binding-like beta-propeller repeat protein [Thermoanaerobaculia bacterium]|nr:PQQ-binding-like beta-propeller repeat protein [Thermoanaerobaculia bacterium]